ncbi:hypothetical protein JCM11491_004716 [Sporobolomyces phaffii]
MIPFYSYSPDNVDPGPGSSSNSYFQPTTHNSAHSFDGIPLAPTETPIPADTHTYSHSAPATPHPAFDPLRPHQYSYTTSSLYQPQYFGLGDNVTGDSTLIGYDQVTAASSSTSSVLGSLEAELQSPRVPSSACFPSFLFKLVEESVSKNTVSAMDDPTEQEVDRIAKQYIRLKLDALWTSKGYHPALRPFLSQRQSLCLGSLPPREQVAVALCCSASLRSNDANAAFSGRPIDSQRFDNQLRARAIEIYDHHEVGYEDSTRAGLVLHILGAQIFSWTASTRKRSRGWLRIALSVYRDLVEAAEDFDSQVRLMREFGLSLLDLDSSLAADAPSFPLISNEDLLVYFSIFPRTTPTSSLATELAPFLTFSPYDHERKPHEVEEVISIIYRWVVLIERWTAEQLSPRGLNQPVSRSAIGIVFGQIAQVHSAIASAQNHIVQSRSPAEQDSSRRDHQLRFLSRLNYQVDEAVYRSHRLVKRRLAQANDGSFQDCNSDTLRSIEERMVESMKRAAFYFRVFSISSFPAECRFLVYSLDCLPTWIRFAVERSSPGGHDSRNNLGLTLSSTRAVLSSIELDWIENGLEGVARYDVAVEEDLVELRELRTRAVQSASGLDFRQALLQVSNELAWI